MACQGQIRLAPNGQVIGIDLNVALQVSAARGYDIAVLAELLPAAEAGIVDAPTSGTQESGSNASDSGRAIDAARFRS